MIVWMALGVAHAGDKDHDGVPTKTDQCPEEAEDADGHDDADGCPEPDDSDGDGLLDEADKCPTDPEDADRFEDADGCPDPDDDRDGVLDAADRCPRESEDGDDGDGCAVVSLKLLTESGWMAAVGELSQVLVAAIAAQPADCAGAASGATAWVRANDPESLGAEWGERLGRAPAGFDAPGATALLAGKGEVYRTLKPALDVFCASDAGWSAIAGRVDQVCAALPPPPPPAPKRRR
ncbi:MAG: hypothetical protein ABMB14_22290 [Myxococcota bacterium]